MTATTAPPLERFLDLAYQHGVGIGGVRTDPAAACVAAGFSHADLETKLAELDAVSKRCVVSKVRADFLRRVIAQMPASG